MLLYLYIKCVFQKLFQVIKRSQTTTKNPSQAKRYPMHSVIQALLHLLMYGKFSLKTEANGTYGLGSIIQISTFQTDHRSILTDIILAL